GPAPPPAGSPSSPWSTACLSRWPSRTCPAPGWRWKGPSPPPRPSGSAAPAASSPATVSPRAERYETRLPVRSGVSQLCGGGVPGCEDGGDLLGFGVSCRTAGNAGADHDPAEPGEHVLEGGPGLGG